MTRPNALLAWLAAGGVLALLFAFDGPLYRAVPHPSSENTKSEDDGVGPRVNHGDTARLLSDSVRATARWPVLLPVFVLLWRLHPDGRRRAIVTVATVFAALLATEGLWRTVSRVRPNGTDPPGTTEFTGLFSGFSGEKRGRSFPSSEATLAGALFGCLWYGVPRGLPVWVALAILAAFNRVYLGAHFPSDVWGGLMVGFAFAPPAERFIDPGRTGPPDASSAPAADPPPAAGSRDAG